MGSTATNLSEVRKEIETAKLHGKSISMKQTVLAGVFVGDSEKFPTKKAGGLIYETVVVVPAINTLSHPTAYCVKSNVPLGSTGEEITIVCDVRSRFYFDTKNIKRFNNELWFVNQD